MISNQTLRLLIARWCCLSINTITIYIYVLLKMLLSILQVETETFQNAC